MKLFKKLIFTTLVFATGRVMAFPAEVTTLTKGNTTILNVKTHRGLGKHNTANAQSLFEYAQKNNALVLIAPNRPLDFMFTRRSARELFFTSLAKNMPQQDKKVLWLDLSDNYMGTFEELLNLPFLTSPLIKDTLYMGLVKSLRKNYVKLQKLVMPQSNQAAELMKKEKPQLLSFYRETFKKIKNGQSSRYLKKINEHSTDEDYQKALFASPLNSLGNLEHKLIADFNPLNDILIVAKTMEALDKGEKNIIICSDASQADAVEKQFKNMGFTKTTLRARSSNTSPCELMLKPILEESSYVLHAMVNLPVVKQLLELIYSAYPRC